MKKIIQNKKILNDALNSGYKFIENNNYEEALIYLNYAKEGLSVNDQYMIYALVICHYNLGHYEEVRKILKNLNKIEVSNDMIKEFLKNIQEDIKKIFQNKENKEKVEEINISKSKDIFIGNMLENIENLDFLQQKILLTQKEMQKIIKTTKHSFLTFLMNPQPESKKIKKYEEYEQSAINVIINFEKFKNYYYDKKKNFNELEIYNYYHSALKSPIYFIFLINGIKTNLFLDIFENNKLSKNFKNELLCDIAFFKENGFLLEEWFEDIENEYKIDFSKLRAKLIKIEELLKKTPIYKEIEIFNYLMKIIYKFLRIKITEIEDYSEEYIVQKVLEYVYFAHLNITEESQKYIQKNYQLNEKEYDKTHKLINYLNLLI